MKQTYFILIAAIFLFLVCPHTSKPDNEVLVNTSPKKETDFYPWITFLSEGPTIWLEEDTSFEIQGRAYRIVVTTAEIYNRVFIEEITKGDEGCCVKIASNREFDLDLFMRKYGFKGERSGFKFLRWLSPTSFEFQFHDRKFRATNIESVQVKIIEVK
ncbi:hypothetical protein ACFL6W_07825 [Thermodesulfobacteriota bacterium]